MNVLYFSSEIDDKAVGHLISDINKQKGEVTVYFESWGGCGSAAMAFIDFTKKTDIKITMVAYGNLMSAGFMMFYLSDTKKETLLGKTTMIHKGSYTKKEWVRAFREGTIKEHREAIGSTDKYVGRCLFDLRVSMPKIARYGKHKDVYFTQAEATCLADNAQKLYYTKG